MNKCQRHLSKPSRTHMLYSVASSYYWGIYCPAKNLEYNRRFLSQWVVWKGSKRLSQETHTWHLPSTHLDWTLGIACRGFSYMSLTVADSSGSLAWFLADTFSSMESSHQACCGNLIIHSGSKVNSDLTYQCIKHKSTWPHLSWFPLKATHT